MTSDDLGRLRERREALPRIKAIRDSHHRLARYIAAGLKLSDAAANAGYSYWTAVVLMTDPSFRELVAQKQKMIDERFVEAIDEYTSLATSNMLKAQRMIADRLDEAESGDTKIATRDLLAIAADNADRFGYGKKSMNVNVNIDFASKLEAARRRSTADNIVELSSRALSSTARGGASVPEFEPSVEPTRQSIPSGDRSPPGLDRAFHPEAPVAIRRRL